VLALIENVGFGGSFAAPAAQGIYLEYLKKTGRSQAADAVSTDSKKIIDGEEIEAQSQPQKKKVRL
jgi:hypothetical protein